MQAGHRRVTRVAVASTILAMTLSGCGQDADPEPPDDDLAIAHSEPREDSVYPEAGDPGVDSLHYDLTLDWAPVTRTLTGSQELTFRATEDADHFQLDLGKTLEVSEATLDGDSVEVEHDGKDLVVRAPVTEDTEYVLTLDYAGTPAPVPAPTTRGDMSGLGLTTTPRDTLWTMQEPYGAYTWYAVNDQPSDKALYDFTVTAPSPLVGIANGELVSRTDEAGVTTTKWHLDSPASSYLTTLAVGDYVLTEDSSGDLPITYWLPRNRQWQLEDLRRTPRLLSWLEKRLGPYPFDSLGLVVVPSASAMETQTMITLGNTDYATGPDTIVHELAHQWYGDLVTPNDWRDLWMNEGMAMYLQGLWNDESTQCPGCSVEEWQWSEPGDRFESGPPGDYDPDEFGENNVYYGPALMWDAFRTLVGDDTFWRLTREWPQEQADHSTDRETWIAWLEEETGRDLDAFFDEWLMSPDSPVDS
ncbi:M1 family metallopeptidase [Nocardioides insulae]|uniref:M1 family metallopeptidase n=1 Tax=Nocardioides insulae TaxID=394734 RepID=UPI00146F458D|nr:M1 family metallopeptidase [Nocardioides insulae]